MKKKIFLGSYLSISLFIIFSNVSYGYLDPSAMTYLIQIMSAILIGCTTAIGVIVYKIKKIWTSKIKKEKVVKMDLNDLKNEKE
jgi:predicted membrane protein